MPRVKTRLLFPSVLIMLVTTLTIPRGSSGQDALSRRDSQGPVTVVVTLAALPAPGDPVRATVVLDTHSVSLDAIVLDKAVTIRMPDGSDVAPTAVEQATGSGHHRSAVLVFPPVDAAQTLRMVVRDVGGVAERSFTWELPGSR